jgi:hypothetical protein
VSGNHNYAVDSLDQPGGVYEVTVTVQGEGTGTTAQGTVTVVRPSAMVAAEDLAGQAGTALTNVVVAAFAEPDVSDTSGEFSATIDWGDKTSSAGTVVGSGGLYEVLGSHTYAAAGYYPVEVDILQGWGQKEKEAQAPGKANVAPAGAAAAPIKVTNVSLYKGVTLLSDKGKELTGDGWWQGNATLPYAFVRKSSYGIVATFALTDPTVKKPPALNIRGVVTGDGDYKANLPQQNVKPEGGTYTYNLTTGELPTMPDMVGTFAPLTITWEAQLPGPGGGWVPVGKAASTVYLLYAPPLTSVYGVSGHPYATAVALGSKDTLMEPTQPQQVLDNLWGVFATQKITTATGEPLTYYKNWVKPDLSGKMGPADAKKLSTLLATGSGQCMTFAYLFYAAIAAQGLPMGNNVHVTSIYVDPKKAPSGIPDLGQGFLVGPWTFPAGAKPTPPNTFPWANKLNTLEAPFPGAKGTKYDWAGAPTIPYQPTDALVGQNNPNPYATFYNHVVVTISSSKPSYTIYDPSYGKKYAEATKTAALAEFQNNAISGFFKMEGTPPGPWTMWIRKQATATPKGQNLVLKTETVPGF